MAGTRRGGGRASTVRLALWGLVMLLLGAGLGFLASRAGCSRPPAGSRETPSGRHGQSRQARRPNEKVGPTEPRKETTGKREPGRKEPERMEPERKEPEAGLPRFALVIDDLGYAAPELVTRLCAQPVPFAVAVLPFQEFTRESAGIAHARGKEVLLHLPMEPVGFPGPSRNPGPGAVMYDSSEQEMRAAVRKALDAVPHHRGVNNHMGSRITPDRLRMGWILDEIKAHDCFFVDSRTEKESVAFDLAKAMGIPAVQRKVFLDDDKDFREMARQWERAIRIAKKEGQVVVIGHIYPETVDALEKLIPGSAGQVAFVKVGALVR